MANCACWPQQTNLYTNIAACKYMHTNAQKRVHIYKYAHMHKIDRVLISEQCQGIVNNGVWIAYISNKADMYNNILQPNERDGCLHI